MPFRFVTLEYFEQPMIELVQVLHKLHSLTEMFKINLRYTVNIEAGRHTCICIGLCCITFLLKELCALVIGG